MKYCAHDYQAYATDFVLSHPYCGLILDMGLGKSVITLTALWDLLLDSFDVGCVLVVAPKRVAEDTWPREIAKWEHLKGLTYSLVMGSEKERRAALSRKAMIYIIYRENVSWLVEHTTWRFDALVFYELSSFFKEKKVWSVVKDELLGCYLVPYFSKLLSTRIPILYVDCFAGKGKFDDGKNGSPLVAIECLNRSLDISANGINNGMQVPEVFLRFIELHHADALKQNLPDGCKGKIEVIDGAFEDEIVGLLRNFVQRYNKRLNVFLYIDPYGIKALNMHLFHQLPEVFSSAELLINLNSFGFLREALRVRKIALRENEDELLSELDEYEPSIMQSVEDLNRIAGGDYWQEIVDKYKTNAIDISAAEKQFAEEYKMVLRKKFRYVLDMPIRLHAANKPKYRMVYATNHPDGCVLMADNISRRTEYAVALP